MRSLRAFKYFLALCCAAVTAFAQALPGAARTSTELPPTPFTEIPLGTTPAPSPAVTPAVPSTLPTRPTLNPRITRPTQAFPAAARPQAASPDSVLQWDSTSKEYTSKPGELTAKISFAVTNISKGDVVINWVRPSCGCTVAKLPNPTPWKMGPGEGGVMDFELDLRGKYGTLSKYISIDTSHGQKLLNFRVTIPTAAANAHSPLPGVDQRTQNMRLALADRQVVFKGDCAKCHVEPGVGKLGEPLYAASCGICHEAPNRATMVPDLKALKFIPTKEYWQTWIENGKPGSLMPAFAQVHGGPLDKEQIASLVEYLTHSFPPGKTATAAIPSGGN